MRRSLLLLRHAAPVSRPRPGFLTGFTMSLRPTSPTGSSPPHKRSRPTPASPSPAPPANAGPSESKSSTEVLEAPLKAMFAPQRTKAEVKKRRSMKHPEPEPYSADDVLWHDVRDFLGRDYVEEVIAKGTEEEWEVPSGLLVTKEHTLRVGAFAVSGDSLSLYDGIGSEGKKWAVLVPFASPGDLVKVKVHSHGRFHSSADLIEILEYSETYRGGEGDRRKFPSNGCKYFGSCGGCQFQPMPYEQQLAHKKRTLQLAYERFSQLSADMLPTIQDTIPSPRQWGYRTKITPHFDAPPRWFSRAVAARDPTLKKGEDGIWRALIEFDEHPKGGKKGRGNKVNFGLKRGVQSANEEDAMNGPDSAEVEPVVDRRKDKSYELVVGYEAKKFRGGVLDIEECPIASPGLNRDLGEERRKIKDGIQNYTKGATLLLRDSLPSPDPSSLPFDSSTPELPEDQHITVTNHKLPVYERVGDHLFTFTAGSFFQNNNSILVPLTSYVRDAIFPPGIPDDKKPTHLVDTYCGSGLFGITLSSRFTKVAGVELDSQAIDAAKKNAEINGLGEKSTWLCGKAEDIFGGLPAAGFAGGHSCVVVDPPRKGCDEAFLEQLLRFKPLTIVYVSCNVHTQARDLGWFLQVGKIRGINYKLESLRGFDLFPQTAHVEGVAVLRLESMA